MNITEAIETLRQNNIDVEKFENSVHMGLCARQACRSTSRAYQLGLPKDIVLNQAFKTIFDIECTKHITVCPQCGNNLRMEN